ncbi:MAG: hypothetical protein AAF602_18070 [Myxococcota bacterium]
MLIRVSLLSWFGCTGQPPSGTLVGNPGKAEGRLAINDDVRVVEADTVLTLEWLGCGRGFVSDVDAQPADLLAGASFPVPAGRWCALVVSLDEPLSFVAERLEQEVVVALDLVVPLTLSVEAPLVIDGDDLVLEIGSPNWFPPELSFEGERLESGVDDELSRLLAADLAVGTALYLDEDGDGFVGAAERAAGPVAAVDFPAPPALVGEDDLPPLFVESGCRTAPGTPLGGPLLLLALWARRRIRVRPVVGVGRRSQDRGSRTPSPPGPWR